MDTVHLIALLIVAPFVLLGIGAFLGATWHSNYNANYHASRRAVIALESAEMQRIREARQMRPEPAQAAPVFNLYFRPPPQEPPTWRPGWRDMPAISRYPLSVIEGDIVEQD